MQETVPPFRIETVKKRAEVFLAGEETLTGGFFLSPVSSYHQGEESLLELLSSERRYIPFEGEDGQVVLLRKKNIIKILLKDREPDLQEETSTHIGVRIQFREGRAIEGKVFFSMPRTSARLSDFLNQSKEFFYLKVNESIYLVNHNHIASIAPVPDVS